MGRRDRRGTESDHEGISFEMKETTSNILVIVIYSKRQCSNYTELPVKNCWKLTPKNLF